MSSPLFAGDVLYFQRLASAAGFYTGKLDGDWGSKTDRAQAAWDEAFASIRTAAGNELDGRTEGLLRTLLPGAQVLMRHLLAKLHVEGLDARVISGTRNYAEQDELFRQGRNGDPRDIVTYARGGQSNHNFGLAVDLGIFAGGRYLNGDQPGDLPPYRLAGKISGTIPGLEWGGLWPGKKQDLPHHQAATGLSLAEVRARFEAGKPYLLPLWTAG